MISRRERFHFDVRAVVQSPRDVNRRYVRCHPFRGSDRFRQSRRPRENDGNRVPETTVSSRRRLNSAHISSKDGIPIDLHLSRNLLSEARRMFPAALVCPSGVPPSVDLPLL